MRTAITEMLAIDVPILAFTHCRDVVAAVTRAEAMGVLGRRDSPEQLEVDLDWIERRWGAVPTGVDVIVPAKYAGSDRRRLHAGRHRPQLIPRARRFRRGHPPAL